MRNSTHKAHSSPSGTQHHQVITKQKVWQQRYHQWWYHTHTYPIDKCCQLECKIWTVYVAARISLTSVANETCIPHCTCMSPTNQPQKPIQKKVPKYTQALDRIMGKGLPFANPDPMSRVQLMTCQETSAIACMRSHRLQLIRYSATTTYQLQPTLQDLVRRRRDKLNDSKQG